MVSAAKRSEEEKAERSVYPTDNAPWTADTRASSLSENGGAGLDFGGEDVLPEETHV